MNVQIPYRSLTFALVIVVLSLCSASIAGQVVERARSSRYIPGLNSFNTLFYMDGEYNVASWYSTCALLLCSLLAGVIAAAGKQHAIPGHRNFAAMSILFLLMSLEETVDMHGMLGRPLALALQPTGFFRFAWVIAGIPIVLVVGMAFVPLLLSLPRQISSRLVAAGTVFVSGAIGLEMGGGGVSENYGFDGLIYQATFHLEELPEMIISILFIYAFFSYIDTKEHKMYVSLSRGRR